MKKLLIATDCFLPRWDGVVRFLLETIPKLSDKYQITVVAPNFGAYNEIPYVAVEQFPVIKINFGDIEFTWFHPFKMRKLAKEADLVFVQTLGPIGVSAINAAKRCKKPLIGYVHSVEWELATRSIKRFKFITNVLSRRVTRHYYNKFDTLIVPSVEVKEKHRKLGISTNEVIVHLGTDTKKFKPPESKAAAKQKLGFAPDLKYIGYSGRIGREKDLITLYRAFRRVEKKHPEARLLIVGKGVKELQEMFSSSRSILMPGAVDNVVDYLQAMDIFVLPSLTETSSLATMEAMACELPVITTPVGFVKEYVREKKNGMLFPFKNSLVLSMKLEMLLENHQMRIELGQNARQTIIETFSWDRTISRIEHALSRF